MRLSAAESKVQVVTGDTKVVDKGKGDGIYINTAGIGIIEHNHKIAPDMVKPGDVIIVNGDIARHGIAVMAVRSELSFESEIDSDCAPVSNQVTELLNAGIEIHCLRDLTRGGVASAMNEISAAACLNINLFEGKRPVRQDVKGACEILGFDPLYVANEGRFAVFVPETQSKKTLEILKANSIDGEPEIIGEVCGKGDGRVILKSTLGTSRIVEMLSGEQLPRIC